MGKCNIKMCEGTEKVRIPGVPSLVCLSPIVPLLITIEKKYKNKMYSISLAAQFGNNLVYTECSVCAVQHSTLLFYMVHSVYYWIFGFPV